MNKRLLNKKTGQRGYTLLELLAAFSLMLMLAVLVFDGLKFGNRVWAKTSETFQNQQETLLVSNLLKDWIENTHPVEAAAGDHLTFKGRHQKLEMVGPLNPGSGFDEFYDITVEFKPLENTLIARWHEKDGRTSGERSLLENLATFEISFLPETLQNQEAQWQDTWENKAALPALVKISFAFEGEGKDRTITLIAKTKIDWGADCIFDISTKTCKGAGS